MKRIERVVIDEVALLAVDARSSNNQRRTVRTFNPDTLRTADEQPGGQRHNPSIAARYDGDVVLSPVARVLLSSVVVSAEGGAQLARTDVVAAIKTRLRETEREAAALRQALEVLGGRIVRGVEKIVGRGQRRGRRRLSAAQRKAVSRRMKKYWAGRKKANAEK